MSQIITIPNQNDDAMNDERERIKPWTLKNRPWVYTGYDNEVDHIIKIKRTSANAGPRLPRPPGPPRVPQIPSTPIRTLDFDCHGSPCEFGYTDRGTVFDFGRSLAQLLGFSAKTEIYLSACNTGLTSVYAPVSIAQSLANAAGCAVYGAQGYMWGTYAEGNEDCKKEYQTLEAYPGAINAKGRKVWKRFDPNTQIADLSDMRTLTVAVDPTQPKEITMSEANSLTINSQVAAFQEICGALQAIMRSTPVEFPKLRMAPDVTINYIHNGQARALDVFANGSLLRDRISGDTWAVKDTDQFTAAVVQHLR